MTDQLQQLQRQLLAAQAQIQRVAADTLAAHAEKVAEDARALAPVATGALRDSIQVVQTDNLHYAVKATAPYAVDVELGTRSMAAEPFLNPAAEANRALLLTSLAAALKSA